MCKLKWDSRELREFRGILRTESWACVDSSKGVSMEAASEKTLYQGLQVGPSPALILRSTATVRVR